MLGDPCRPQAQGDHVIDVLSDLFILQGMPAYIRSDNGLEFLAKAIQEWIAVVGAVVEVCAIAKRDLKAGEILATCT